MLRCSVLLIALMVSSLAKAQESPSKFGEISKKNLEMTIYPKDSSAGAVVLMDWGYVNFDYNFEVQLQRHIRIKILNSTKFDLADIKIPHYRKDRVEKLEAATYNLVNCEIVADELDKDDIFVDNYNEYTKHTSFALKNVREGSIIEYTYRVNYGSFSQIPPWYFQREIPTMHSEYYVELPEAFEYKKVMRGYIPLADAVTSKKNMRYQGSTIMLTTQHYVAKDVPAFISEPHLTTKEDYISKIYFELYAINIPGSAYNRYMPNSYGDLAYNLAKDEDFGKRLEKGRFLRDETEKITAGLSDDLEKTKAIYHFVQEEFEVDVDFEETNYKKIFDERRGYSMDLNFILIMMLKEAGIETEPVVISTRQHGLVHPLYPSFRNFNYVLALATIGEESYLLDASDKFLDFNNIGSKCLNGQGLVVSETNPRWINLRPTMSNMKMTTANCTLSEDGTMHADIKIDRQGYIAMNFKRDRDDEDDEYLKDFKETHTGWEIEKHEISGLESREESLVEKYSFTSEEHAESLGDIIYINPMVIGRYEENPFKLEERIYPVNYGAPVKEVISYSIDIPEGYLVDELPQPVAVALPDNAGKFLYSVSAVGNKIMVNSQFLINKVEFSTEEYPYLRAFYSQIVAKQAEQVVLKKKT